MPKLTYEQMKVLSESGEDPGGKLIIKNKKGKVLRTRPQKWENLMHPHHPSTSQAWKLGYP